MKLENLELKSPSLNELPKIIDFLDKGFQSNVSWSISQEYPTVFCKQNLHNIQIISQEEKIISHAVLKVIIIKTAFAIYKIGAIGSIFTDNKYRNLGLSKKLINQCINLAQKQNCELVILWSDLIDFYKKFDFYPAGFEIAFLLDKTLDVALPEEGKFVSSNKIDPAAILNLYNKHTVNSVRNFSEVKSFLQIPNSEIYTYWNVNNQLSGYAVCGKGRDFHNYIHEWGGDLPYLLYLLSYIQKTKNEKITVICPYHSYNFINAMKKYQFESYVGVLGLLKIINYDLMIPKIVKAASILGVDNLIIKKEGKNIFIGCKSDHLLIKSEEDFLYLLFGPKPLEMLFSEVAEDFRIVLKKVFPLPLWIWGWDSI